jgi:hypothetical protein
VSWAGLDDGDFFINFEIQISKFELAVGMVSRLGFEPRTPALKGRCSTN